MTDTHDRRAAVREIAEDLASQCYNIGSRHSTDPTDMDASINEAVKRIDTECLAVLDRLQPETYKIEQPSSIVGGPYYEDVKAVPVSAIEAIRLMVRERLAEVGAVQMTYGKDDTPVSTSASGRFQSVESRYVELEAQLRTPQKQQITTKEHKSMDRDELREQVERYVAGLAESGHNFMKPEAVSTDVRNDYVDSFMRLITTREVAARLDELKNLRTYFTKSSGVPLFVDSRISALTPPATDTGADGEVK